MIKLSCLLIALGIFSIEGQVGINTETLETSFEVVGKPDDLNHCDELSLRRIIGIQSAVKNYSISKIGAVVFAINSPANSAGKVINITEPGLYYFDGLIWQSFSKEKQPIEYGVLLTFEHSNTINLSATKNWSAVVNHWGNTNVYLTFSKNDAIGAKNFGCLKGSVHFRKTNGIVNAKFQRYKSSDSDPITGIALINIPDIYRDLG